MSHQHQPLLFHPFGDADPLGKLLQSDQVQYVRKYLTDLGATSVLEEPAYFDRDYLEEFAAFYATSTRGYGNLCRRLHFFSGDPIDHDRLEAALAVDPALPAPTPATELQESYLGFIVVRPIPAAPLGRTVLRWYKESIPERPRDMAPSRDYDVHLAGLRLTVRGLAWQQQDSATGACATVSLWSMLHSSGNDEHHAVPTTTHVTRTAHRTASLGARIFPSDGLTVEQVLEAIKENGFSPVLIEGDVKGGGITRKRFTTAVATLVRSGYTALLVGELQGEGRHSVCAVGFRRGPTPAVAPGRMAFDDETMELVYIHDDNLGPGARFAVNEVGGRIELKSTPPAATSGLPNPALRYPILTPHHIIVAIPNELRLSWSQLANEANALSVVISLAASILSAGGSSGVNVGARFALLRTYLGEHLPKLMPRALAARVRLELLERVRPMSLHLGIVRVAVDGEPLIEVLYDTTDSDRNTSVFATLALHPQALRLVEWLKEEDPRDWGVVIQAY